MPDWNFFNEDGNERLIWHPADYTHYSWAWVKEREAKEVEEYMKFKQWRQQCSTADPNEVVSQYEPQSFTTRRLNVDEQENLDLQENLDVKLLENLKAQEKSLKKQIKLLESRLDQ